MGIIISGLYIQRVTYKFTTLSVLAYALYIHIPIQYSIQQRITSFSDLQRFFWNFTSLRYVWVWCMYYMAKLSKIVPHFKLKLYLLKLYMFIFLKKKKIKILISNWVFYILLIFKIYRSYNWTWTFHLTYFSNHIYFDDYFM